MTLDNLLTAIGVPDTLDSLGATDTGSTVTLDLTIGAGAKSTSSGASGWGLEVGIGLDVNLQLSVLGLATIGVVAPDSSTGNLVDLQLAYTSADDVDATDPSGAPPALT